MKRAKIIEVKLIWKEHLKSNEEFAGLLIRVFGKRNVKKAIEEVTEETLKELED